MKSLAVATMVGLASSLAVTVVAARQQPALPTVKASWAAEHVGEVVNVCGRVVDVTCAEKRVRFSITHRDTFVTAVLDAIDRPLIGERLGRFLLQDACIAGRIEKNDEQLVVLASPGAGIKIEETFRPIPAGFSDALVPGCDDGVSPPVVLRSFRPRYPPAAMQAKLQGTVVLLAVVLGDGRVGDVAVTKALDGGKFGLDHEALASVQQWIFKPATRQGEPVPVILRIEHDFKLR